MQRIIKAAAAVAVVAVMIGSTPGVSSAVGFRHGISFRHQPRHHAITFKH